MTPLWGEGQTLTSHCQLGGVAAGLMDGRHPPAPLLPSGRPLALPASVTPLPSPHVGPGLGVGTD